jgi:hypothetical protein
MSKKVKRLNYTKAEDFLANGRAKTHRPIDKSTTVRKEGDDIVVKYHNTDIVTYKSNGDIEIFFNGYHTITTRQRISALTGYACNGHKGMSTIATTIVANKATIKSDGNIITDYDKNLDDEMDDMKKRIKKYAKAYAEQFRDMDMPSGGDCWYCSLFQKHTSDHLISHMEDEYYVPSLLLLAGYRQYLLNRKWVSLDLVQRAIYNYMKKVILSEMVKGEAA